MKLKPFITCWLFSSILMYALSYAWHGLLLNDYMNIRTPLWLYFTLATIVYLVIGLVLTLLYRNTQTKEMRFKGLLMGALLGFFIYLIAFVLGVSFNQASASHIVVDFVWQMIEQGIGGASVGFVYGLLLEFDKVKQANQ